LLAQALPANLKSAASQQLVDMVNNVVADPIVAEEIRNNFVSYAKVLADGKYKIEDYLSAVQYVSYKLMGDTNQDAYFKTFPQRHANLVASGADKKKISAYVAMYAKGKLVNALMEQTLVPVWVLNQELHQRAINVQADLMVNAQSEKVRCEAANSLLTHLAKPREAAALVNIDLRESSGMNELRATLVAMAQQQQQLIEAGVSTKDVAGQRLVVTEQ
jgi:hypothetical protein